MKHRHIAAALIMLSLIASMFIAVAAAATYYPPGLLTVVRKGITFTFTVDTSIAVIENGNPQDPNENRISYSDFKRCPPNSFPIRIGIEVTSHRN